MAATAEGVRLSMMGPLGGTLQHVDGLPPPDLALPALEPVNSRETYRTRPDDELEDATWFSAEQEDTLVPPTKTRLRSIHSKQATVITFANKSTYRVRALWMDFTGNEVVYSVLEPNTTRRYHTYQTHPWLVRELLSGTRMLLSGRPAVVGMSQHQTVEIQAPPLLQWSLDKHACFPEPFKAAVRGLIQAHKQLEPFAGGSASAGASSSPCRALPPPTLATGSPSSAAAAGDAPDSPPCSPRATLLRLGHGAALPTSPKARRLSAWPSPLSPRGAAAAPRTPRAATGLAGSPAGTSDVASTTATISISGEAAHFTATLTVSSPTRAALKQTLAIQVFNSSAVPALAATNGGSGASTSSAAHANADVIQLDDQGAACSSGGGGAASACASSSSSGKRGSKRGFRARQSLFGNWVHSFKNAFRPGSRSASPTGTCAAAGPSPAAATTTTIKLHLQSMLQEGEDAMDVDDSCPGAASASTAAWPPVGAHLGDIPSHLLAHIAQLAAPVVWQTLEQCPAGRPDILPTLLACPPEAVEEDAPQEEEEGGGAQQDGDGGAQPPALV